MHAAHPLAVASLAVALAAAAAAQEVASSAPPPAATGPSARELRLALADLGEVGAGGYSLRGDAREPTLATALWGPATAFGTAGDAGRPILARVRSFGLSMRLETGAEGRRRLVFTPLTRDWDDLTGWEKFAVTLQYAGAAAAIGHFVEKLAK